MALLETHHSITRIILYTMVLEDLKMGILVVLAGLGLMIEGTIGGIGVGIKIFGIVLLILKINLTMRVGSNIFSIPT